MSKMRTVIMYSLFTVLLLTLPVTCESSLLAWPQQVTPSQDKTPLEDYKILTKIEAKGGDGKIRRIVDILLPQSYLNEETVVELARSLSEEYGADGELTIQLFTDIHEFDNADGKLLFEKWSAGSVYIQSDKIEVFFTSHPMSSYIHAFTLDRSWKRIPNPRT